MKQQATIKGKVEYREGDGTAIPIRPGPVEVQTAQTDVTLSWADGDTRGSTAMPLSDFRRYVDEGLIELKE